MLPIIRCRTFDWHTNCKFSKEWFSWALLSAVPETFVKLQLDESKDVFVAHTSLGGRVWFAENLPQNRLFLTIVPRGLILEENTQGILCIAGWQQWSNWFLDRYLQAMSGNFPRCIFLSCPNHSNSSPTHPDVVTTPRCITTPRCGHITECITYDGVIIWPCFARDGSWVTPHISVWPHSHSIWRARTNHRRLFRRSCKKCNLFLFKHIVTPRRSPCYSQSPTVPAPRPGRAHVHT